MMAEPAQPGSAHTGPHRHRARRVDRGLPGALSRAMDHTKIEYDPHHPSIGPLGFQRADQLTRTRTNWANSETNGFFSTTVENHMRQVQAPCHRVTEDESVSGTSAELGEQLGSFQAQNDRGASFPYPRHGLILNQVWVNKMEHE